MWIIYHFLQFTFVNNKQIFHDIGPSLNSLMFCNLFQIKLVSTYIYIYIKLDFLKREFLF